MLAMKCFVVAALVSATWMYEVDATARVLRGKNKNKPGFSTGLSVPSQEVTPLVPAEDRDPSLEVMTLVPAEGPYTMCLCITTPCDCSGEASDLDESTLTQCPDPNPLMGGCIQIYSPVVCGALQCEYSNDCYARFAGWRVETQCEPVSDREDSDSSCPPTSPNIRCGDLDLNTYYMCGPNMCTYESECMATGAGWNITEDCYGSNELVDPLPTDGFSQGEEVDENDCPVIGPAITCPAENNPVQCTRDGGPSCEYPNDCTAEGAGWNATEECYVLNELVDPPMQGSEVDEKGCPLVGPAVMCPAYYAPVQCTRDDGLVCEYSNACAAGGAGWNEEGACKATSNNVDGEIFEASTCPESTGLRYCADVFAPLVCSNDSSQDCFYDNDCFAENAGFDVATQCEAARPTCPKPNMQDGPCPDTVRPLTCTNGFFTECRYENRCFARNAGFRPRNECTRIAE